MHSQEFINTLREENDSLVDKNRNLVNQLEEEMEKNMEEVRDLRN